jgi:hypothetical protein
VRGRAGPEGAGPAGRGQQGGRGRAGPGGAWCAPTRRRIAGSPALPGRSDVAARCSPLLAARRSVGVWRDPAFVRLYRTRSTADAGSESGRARTGRFGPRFGPDCALRRPLTTLSCRQRPSGHGPRSAKPRTGAKLSGCTGQTQLIRRPILEETAEERANRETSSWARSRPCLAGPRSRRNSAAPESTPEPAQLSGARIGGRVGATQRRPSRRPSLLG